MRETRELLSTLRRLRSVEAPATVATIVAVEGSAYRREGSRMLIEADGAMTGVLSGGCVERELLAPARAVLASGQPRMVRLDLSAEEEAIWGFGLGCSGTITLLLEPLASSGDLLERVLAAVIEARQTIRLETRVRSAGEPSAPLVTVAREIAAEEGSSRKPGTSHEGNGFDRTPASPTGDDLPPRAPLALGSDRDSPEPSREGTGASRAPSGATDRDRLPLPWKPLPSPNEARTLRAATESQNREEQPLNDSGPPSPTGAIAPAPAGEWTLVERLVPPVHLVVVGGERDVVPLVRLAAELGWQVSVVDARATAEAEARVAPFARYLGSAPRRIAEAVPLDARTAVLVATHRFLDDLAYLGELADAGIGYLGLLGPAGRRDRLLADLARQRGTQPAVAARLRGPAGLDLGGRTPHEIALAVVAEIQAALSGGTGLPLVEKRRAEPASSVERQR